MPREDLWGHGAGEGSLGVLSFGSGGDATAMDSGAGRCLPAAEGWPFPQRPWISVEQEGGVPLGPGVLP